MVERGRGKKGRGGSCRKTEGNLACSRSDDQRRKVRNEKVWNGDERATEIQERSAQKRKERGRE